MFFKVISLCNVYCIILFFIKTCTCTSMILFSLFIGVRIVRALDLGLLKWFIMCCIITQLRRIALAAVGQPEGDWYIGPICVSIISETGYQVIFRNELNNHLPLSGFIHQTTSKELPTLGLLVCLHKQLGTISRLRYLSDSKTFIILSCQRTSLTNLM
jgi:hypothetical protein